MAVASPRARGQERAVRPGRLDGLRRRLERLPAYRDPRDRRRILRWLGAGLLVRLAVMPFAFSSDFTAVY
ncbi:MAG: hypothetical protein GEU81_14500, partial [Nitriliruptorales bacterium]|nr:hypothetical protein [Nitriliruptorales bacterium]